MTKREFDNIQSGTIVINHKMKKPFKLYESRKGLIINDTINLKIFDKEYILAVTNYGLKICLNAPKNIKEHCSFELTYDNMPKRIKYNFVITIICNINDKLEEPLTLWLDKNGDVLNKYRIIDFKYNKFIDECEDFISDMKVEDIEEIVGELGNITAVSLLHKVTKALKRKFIKRSKKNV